MSIRRIVFISFFLAFLASISAYAQDIILMKDNTLVRAVVQEINDDSVVYRDFNNQNGPLYRVSISRVAKIQFQNGTEQVFSVSTPQAAARSRHAGLGTMVFSNGSLQLDGRVLSDHELHYIIGEDIFTETLIPARKQISSGDSFIFEGALIGSLGALLLVFNNVLNDPTDIDDLESYANGLRWGGLFLASGCTLLSIGIPLKVIGKSRMRWIASDYNSHYEPMAEVRFGSTPGGIGFTFNF